LQELNCSFITDLIQQGFRSTLSCKCFCLRRSEWHPDWCQLLVLLPCTSSFRSSRRRWGGRGALRGGGGDGGGWEGGEERIYVHHNQAKNVLRQSVRCWRYDNTQIKTPSFLLGIMGQPPCRCTCFIHLIFVTKTGPSTSASI